MNDKRSCKTVEAIIDTGVIFCGKCGHKIAGAKGLRCGLGNGTIYLLCKHKDFSIKCLTMNEIRL